MAYCILADLKEQIREDDLINLTDDRSSLASDFLGSGATATSTTLTLSDSSAFPTFGRVEVDNEQIEYTGNASNILTGCTRGANDTTAVAHDNGSTVTEINRIDGDVIDRAIADADSVINSYCSSQFETAFSIVPEIIRKISVDLAIYNLYGRRKGAPEDRRRRRDDAINFLKDVARGVVQLGDADVTIDSDTGPETALTTEDLTFTNGHDSDSSTGTLDNF